MWHYSACAIAITFLKSLSAQMRSHLRKIVLCEDYGSVCRPECHALGLIGFRTENPALQVERRVNLWRNILPATSEISVYDIVHEWNLPFQAPPSPDAVLAFKISTSLREWLTEALALSAAGMPAQSFTLVIDGQPAPIQSSAVFEIVKWDAAWQLAFDQWEQSRPPIQNYADWRKTGEKYPHKFDAFPQTIMDIMEGSSFIRCTFPLGEPCDLKGDAQRLLDTHSSLPDCGQWVMSQARSYARFTDLPGMHTDPDFSRFSLLPPLPSFREIRLEEVIREEPSTAASLEDE